MSEGANHSPKFMARLFQYPIVQQIMKSGVGTGFRLASVGMGMLFAILAARIVGADEFGRYVSLLAIATLSATALTVGFPQLLAREIATARGRPASDIPPDAIPKYGAMRDLIVALAIILTTVVILTWLLLEWHQALVATFAVLTVLCAFLGATVTGYERVLRGAMTTDVVKPGIALLGLVILGATVMATAPHIFAAQIAGASVAAVVLIAIIGLDPFRRFLHLRLPAPTLSSTHFSILKTGFLLAGTQLLIGATTQVDILILTALEEPAQVSYYFAAARAALVVSFFFGINAAFAEPTLTRLIAQGDRPAVEQLAIRTARSGLGATLLAVIGAIVMGRIYLDWYGPNFSQAYPSLLVMLFGLTIWSVFGPTQVLARAARLDRELLIITFGSVLINVAISLFLVPRLGLIGAAIGTSCQFSIYGIALYVLIRSKLGYRSSAFNSIST